MKKLALFLAYLQRSYAFAQSYILECLLEKFPHKNMPIEVLYIYHKLAFDVAKECPKLENKILETIVERLCNLDVDIKLKKRKFEFSQSTKIQSFESYRRELFTKIQDDREIKLGILMEQLMDYIDERISNSNSDEARADMVDQLMKIFEKKIFPITKLNFLQYLPIFVMISESN